MLARRAAVSQQLVQGDHRVEPAFEIMRVNPAVSNLIRDAKQHQLGAVLQSSAAEGMRTMDGDLLRLFRAGVITAENALHCSIDREQMTKRLKSLQNQ